MPLNLDKLLETLDVRLHAFAMCQIDPGHRLVFDPMEAVVIHYVLAGTGILRVGKSPPAAFGPHTILIVPPGQAQSLSSRAEKLRDVPAAESSAMIADGLVKFTAGPGEGEIFTVCGTISATYRGALGLFDHLTGPIVEDVSQIAQLRSAFDIMLAELAQPGIGTRALTDALMKQCMVLLLRKHLTQHGAESPLFALLRDPRLVRAISVILERPNGRHTLDDLALAAGMSRSSFAEHFSQTFSETPLDFVNRVRLRHAAHLLGTTELPIKVIASSVGYLSRSHFSRAFRAAYDLDPKTYRSLKSLGDDPAPPEAMRPGLSPPSI